MNIRNVFKKAAIAGALMIGSGYAASSGVHYGLSNDTENPEGQSSFIVDVLADTTGMLAAGIAGMGYGVFLRRKGKVEVEPSPEALQP